MKKLLLIIGGLVVAGVAYWLISPLFIVREVHDPDPVQLMDSGIEDLSPKEMADFEAAMEVASTEPVVEVAEPMPEVMMAGVDTMMTYPVMGTSGHPASGVVRVIESNGETILRFEDFETINGPALNLYLAKDLEATEYIDLGPIRGTKGNINYVVPEGVDLSAYRYVMHWCVPFRVLFNYAELQ